jgi:hypothetical protein
VPLGFTDIDQLRRCSRDLADAMERQRGPGDALIIGSSTSGWSMNMSKPADAFGEESDIDIVLHAHGLLAQMMEAQGEPDRQMSFLGAYVWLRNDGPRGFLTVCPHLAAFASKWSTELVRPVDLRLLLARPGYSTELDAMLDYGRDGRGGPIELVRNGVPLAGDRPADATSPTNTKGFWERLFGGGK